MVEPPKRLTRRALLGGVATLPLVALVSSPSLLTLTGCGDKPPETPLAHLYGREWVHGAYRLYATKYAGVEAGAEAGSRDAYRVLAQKGVASLEALQSRDVPFFVRVDASSHGFAIERNVPERLTFTSSMSEADRAAMESAWKKAREHVHKDYEEIRRLNWALTQLLGQLRTIRNAIEEGRLEQYRLVSQLADLKRDPANIPYQLPFQVTPKDYEEIMLLLVERLEDDKRRLMFVEANVVAVGMTVRATDANSATLSTSIRKILLAIALEAPNPSRAPEFPADADEKAKFLDAARKLAGAIEAGPEYAKFRADEREKKLASVGMFLQVLDSMTNLPTSRVFRVVMDVWRGDQDYLGYVKSVLSFIPQGSKVGGVLGEVVDYTEKARKGELTQAVLNRGSRFATDRVQKQLAYFKDQTELKQVEDALAQTEMMKLPLPEGVMRL